MRPHGARVTVLSLKHDQNAAESGTAEPLYHFLSPRGHSMGSVSSGLGSAPPRKLLLGVTIGIGHAKLCTWAATCGYCSTEGSTIMGTAPQRALAGRATETA